MAYDAGEAFLQIVPSFQGVAQRIDAEATRWGVSGGKAYARAFNEQVRANTNNAALGPSTQQTARQAQQSGRTFADTFKARVEAALRSLPDIQINANSSDAEVRIARLRTNLEQLSSQRVGVDIDAATALATVDNLKRQIDELAAETPDVAVRIDTGRASAELARIQAEIDALRAEEPEVDVDVDDHGSAESTRGRVNGLAAALISLAPLGVAVGAALVGGLAGVGATIGAVVGGIGVLTLGLSGTSSAVKLLGQEQDAQRQASVSAGKAAGTQAKQQAAAAQQIRSAQQTLADARREQTRTEIDEAQKVKQAQQQLTDARTEAARSAQDSAEKVQNAQQNLADVEARVARDRQAADRVVAGAEDDYRRSVEQVQEAEQALVTARQAAQRDLDNYANSQVDANLAQQQAILDLQDAQTNAAKITASDARTDAEKQQAVLNLAKAQQNLVEANQRLADTTADNNAAQKAGVSGAPGVVSAAKQVAQAKRDQQDAADKLTQAEQASVLQQQQGARDVAKAQQDVSDAVREQSRAQQDSAQRVAQAQLGVQNAVRDQTRAQEDAARRVQRAQQSVAEAMRSAGQAATAAGAAGGGALAGIRSQLDKLSPATLQFAKFLRGQVSPVIDRLKATAAKNLLPGVTDGIKSLLPLAPTFSKIIGSIARTLGDLARQAGAALSSPFWKQFFQFIGKTAGPILQTLGKIIGNVATGFAGLFEAFQPIVSEIGNGLLGISRAFADFGKSASHNAAFQSFLGYIKQVGPIVVDVIGNLGRILGHLLVAFAPLGKVMLIALDAITKFLASLSPNQLLLLIGALGTLVALVGGPVTAAVVAVTAIAALIVRNWSKIRPVIQPVLNLFRDIFGFIRDKIVPVIKGIFAKALEGLRRAFQIVGQAIKEHRGQLQTVVNAFKAVYTFIYTKILPILGPILKGVFIALGYVIKTIITIIAYLVNTIKALITAATAVVNFFRGPFVKFFVDAWNRTKAVVLGAWNTIRRYFSDAVNWVKTTFMRSWNVVKNTILVPVNLARNAISTAWNAIRSFFSSAVNWVRSTFTRSWNAVKNAVTSPISAARSLISSVWSGIRSIFSGAVNWAKSTFTRSWNVLKTIIEAPIKLAKQGIDTVWSGIKAGANAVKTALGKIWNGIKTVFAAPINAVIRYVYNDGIRWVWNHIVDAVGLSSLDLPAASLVHFAEGGIYPGYTPGRDVGLAHVSGGESIMRPEWTRAMGPGYVHAANAAARSGGVTGVRRFVDAGHYATGGIVGNLTSLLGGAAGKTISPAKVYDWIKDKINAVTGFVSSHFGTATDWLKAAAKAPFQLAGRAISGLWNKVKELIGKAITADREAVTGISTSKALIAKITQEITMLKNDRSLTAEGRRAIADQLGQDASHAGFKNPDGGVQAYRPIGLEKAHPIKIGGESGYIGSDARWHRVYDKGGLLPPGYSSVFNGTGKPELVAPKHTFEQILNNTRNTNYDGPLISMPVTQMPLEDGVQLAERVSARVQFRMQQLGAS